MPGRTPQLQAPHRVLRFRSYDVWGRRESHMHGSDSCRRDIRKSLNRRNVATVRVQVFGCSRVATTDLRRMENGTAHLIKESRPQRCDRDVPYVQPKSERSHHSTVGTNATTFVILQPPRDAQSISMACTVSNRPSFPPSSWLKLAQPCWPCTKHMTPPSCA